MSIRLSVKNLKVFRTFCSAIQLYCDILKISLKKLPQATTLCGIYFFVKNLGKTNTLKISPRMQYVHFNKSSRWKLVYLDLQ